MTEIHTRAVLDALHGIADPCSIAAGVPIDLVDMGLVADVGIDAGHVTLTLQLTSPFCMQIGLLSDRISATIGAIDGVTGVDVTIDHTAEWLPSMIAPSAQQRLRTVRPFPVEPVAVRR